MVLDVLGNIMIDRRRQCQVEETVRLRSSGKRVDVRMEFGEGTLVCVFPADIRVPAEEGRQALCFCVQHLGQRVQPFKQVLSVTEKA